MRKQLKTSVIILIILLIAILLRIADAGRNSLYGDELTITLDAYSLLKTGQDQLGNFMPLTFPMGAGRPAGYVYGSIPFVAIFGQTALGVRALSILSGIGILILLYLLGKRLFSEKVGILAAAITAVSPWDISLSRAGFEAHFALFLALLGTYLFIKAKEKPLMYIFSALCFGLTWHTYPTYKVSLLLFLPLLFWYQGSKVIASKKHFIPGILVLIILGVLALSQTFIGGSEKRFAGINIFSQEQLKNSIEQKINLERQITNLPGTAIKYFHNKPVEYAKVLIENYLQNFSLDFLVLHGDRNPRHNMATMGEIYFAEIILILIGVYYFWQRQKRLIFFLVAWILLAPIPTAVVDLPHALRSSFMLPPLILLSALGLLTILNYESPRLKPWYLLNTSLREDRLRRENIHPRLKAWYSVLYDRKRIILAFVLVFFIIQFIFFAYKLYFLAPNEYSNFWSYPAKLASEIATENRSKYDYVILSDRIDDIEFAYPAYAQIAPDQVITQNKTSTYLSGYKLKKYGNLYIGYIPEAEIDKLLRSFNVTVLYIGGPSVKNYLNEYESVNGLDGQTALVLERVNK